MSKAQNTWKPPDQSSLHDICRTGNFHRKLQTFNFFSKTSNGGAERDRTADPLLAKQVLSQLSYSPIQLDRPGHHVQGSATLPASVFPRRAPSKMVGPGRLELPTPRLSSVCSNQLSYGPIQVTGPKARSTRFCLC